MKQRNLIVVGAVVLVGILVVALYFWPKPVEEKGIPIATVGPMSGKLAALGEQQRRGAEMAVADINAAGGVLGQELILTVDDDACESKQAVAVANKLASDGVKFVAGHLCSGASIAASDAYTEEGIIQISPASTNPTFTDEGGPNVFRVCGRDDQQGKFAGEFLWNRFMGKKVAILHDRSAYGKGLADETRKFFEAAGGMVALYEAYTAGEKDYSAVVSKLKGAAIDVVYVGGYHTEAGLIIRQAYEQGYRPHLVSGDALVTDEYWQITGPAGEGTLFSFSPDPARDPNNAAIVKRFSDQGFKPEGFTLYTYAAIQAWAQAANAAGSTKPDNVISSLRSNEFNTVLGPIRFDNKGDVSAPGYVFYEWSNGAYDYAN